MEKEKTIYGAKACVYIKSEESICTLGDRISDEFLFSKFTYDTSEDPPFELQGSAQVLGFEVWLEVCFDSSNYDYLLKLETSHSLEESFNDKMHDLSLWLARYISDICEIEAYTEPLR